jgi:hypothetical protein
MAKLINQITLCVSGLFTTSLFITSLLVSVAYAGTATVKWQEPDKYTDIRSGDSGKTQFRKNVFNQLEKHLVKLTSELPEDFELQIKVTNLNLAGQVEYNFAMSRDIRIVKNLYWPMIEFEYQVLVNKQKVKIETVKLKDMAFMSRGGSNRLSHDTYYYEKRLLTDWFNKNIENMVPAWQEQQNAIMGE